MAQIRATASAEIPASPAKVYAILADYHNGHPYLLPKSAFAGLEVERGGIGDGTIIRVHMRLGGSPRTMRMEVTEPDPGHILAETDLDSGAVTTFTVTPRGIGQRSHVEIVTEWEGRGIRGLVERLFAPAMLEKIYAEELRNLALLAPAYTGDLHAV